MALASAQQLRECIPRKRFVPTSGALALQRLGLAIYAPLPGNLTCGKNGNGFGSRLRCSDVCRGPVGHGEGWGAELQRDRRPSVGSRANINHRAAAGMTGSRGWVACSQRNNCNARGRQEDAVASHSTQHDQRCGCFTGNHLPPGRYWAPTFPSRGSITSCTLAPTPIGVHSQGPGCGSSPSPSHVRQHGRPTCLAAPRAQDNYYNP